MRSGWAADPDERVCKEETQPGCQALTECLCDMKMSQTEAGVSPPGTPASSRLPPSGGPWSPLCVLPLSLEDLPAPLPVDAGGNPDHPTGTAWPSPISAGAAAGRCWPGVGIRLLALLRLTWTRASGVSGFGGSVGLGILG